ncbi:MAG: hypothetical protein QM775_28210 [Pirellulales bacterium]
MLRDCDEQYRNWEWNFLVRWAFPERHRIADQTASLSNLSWSRNGKTLIALDNVFSINNLVVQIDPATQQIIKRFSGKLSSTQGVHLASHLAVSDDGAVVAANAGRSVLVWNAQPALNCMHSKRKAFSARPFLLMALCSLLLHPSLKFLSTR